MRTIRTRAFSLVELMVAVVVVGTIATFAIPKYTRYTERTYRDDAIKQLTVIYIANNEYYLKSNPKSYWPGAGGNFDVSAINSNLGLTIIENGMTYTCAGTSATFTCTAVRNAATPFTITVTQAALSAANPSCTSGACP